MSVSIVTGGAGFIGPNLIRSLLQGHTDTCIVADNLSNGNWDTLRTFFDSNELKNVIFCKCNAADYDELNSVFEIASSYGRLSEVWHLAANSDIPLGIADISLDYNDTFMSTYQVLRCMEKFDVENIYFASSSAIYGNHFGQTLFENSGPLLPISNYGAMKLSSEAIISARSEVFLKRALLFRFPNVIGSPATHGVIYDFIKKLMATPKCLSVLGDGTQCKPYLHVKDLVNAMLYLRGHTSLKGAYPINIGAFGDGVSVKEIAEIVCSVVNPAARIEYGSGDRGWQGDVPKVAYSTALLQELGWTPKLSPVAAVELAVQEIYTQLTGS